MTFDFKKAIAIGTIASTPIFITGCNIYQKASIPSGPTSTQPTGEATIKDASTVIFANGQFTPNKAEVKKGQKVIIKNDSSTRIEFNSDPHPTHSLYPELNIGSIEAGGLKTLTISKEGTYTYHNHLNASQRGQLIVE